MKKLIMLICLCLSAQAFALEVAGVKLEDQVQLADARLLLNGAGVRIKLIFKVYVAGLYLDMKSDRADVILDNSGPKRVVLVMKRDLESQDLLKAFNKGMADNNSPGILKALEKSIRDFSAIFDETGEVKEGDVIAIDYIPGFGTRVSINGVERGRVEGGLAFYRALLKVWLGDDPVDSALKEDLLGG